MVVHQSAKLPDRESRDNGEKEKHGFRAKEASDDGSNENDAGDGSYYQVFHNDNVEIRNPLYPDRSRHAWFRMRGWLVFIRSIRILTPQADRPRS